MTIESGKKTPLLILLSSYDRLFLLTIFCAETRAQTPFKAKFVYLCYLVTS